MKTHKPTKKKKSKIPAPSAGKMPSKINNSARAASGKKSKKEKYGDKTIYNFSYFLKLFG